MAQCSCLGKDWRALWGNYWDKGNQLALEGKLQYRTYEDKEGNTRYITEIVANEFVKLTKETKKEDLPF